MLRKLSLLFIALGMSCCLSFSQIVLTPYVDATTKGLDENNVSVLENNLRTLISRTGLEAGYGGRFILAANVNLLDKSMTNSAPVKVLQKVQITFAIGDSQSGICYGTASMECRGLGETDKQAMLNSFRNLRPTPELKALIAESKQRIISYYEMNGPAIIANARSLVTGQRYEEALYELSFIPSECSIFPQAAAMMSDIYQQNINHDSAQLLAQAQALWSSDPNPGLAADEALKLLGQINTDAACYKQAQSLMNTIQRRIQTVTDREYADDVAYRNAQLNAATKIASARITAAKAVAVAYAQSRPKVVYHVHNWW